MVEANEWSSPLKRATAKAVKAVKAVLTFDINESALALGNTPSSIPNWIRAVSLYNCWKRWGDVCVFARIMEGFATEAIGSKTVSIDATYLKVHRTASSLSVRKGEVNILLAHQRQHELKVAY